MAAGSLAETAKLVASLELKDRFTPAANKAMASLGRLEGTAFRVGQNIGKGLQNAARNIGRIGIVAGAGIALMVRSGIGHLAELEDATTSVDGAIKQMGLTGSVTSAQIATWANDIEANIGAAFDDKEIVQATATLLRFGKVTPANIQPAMQVITDLATKTGSVDSAATLLAKALADPTKAAGKLARSGVILTKTQQDQIKAFVKAGKTARAQRVILDALTETTKDAAKASQGPYRRALSVLADVTEDAQKALAIGFLPVLERVSSILSTELAKPATLTSIKEFGQSLAGGLDKLISIAKNLPWDTIGNSLRIAGTGAKAVLDAFTGLPSWVQTAVLTGWGLNKLTGGALTGIVKELGGGLFGHFLERGSSPANPMFVAGIGLPGIGGGGLPGGAMGPPLPWSSTAGGTGGLSGLLKGLPMIGIAVIAAQAAQTLANAVLTNAKPLLTDAGVPEPAADIGTNTIGFVTDVLTGHPFDALNRLPDIATGIGTLVSLIGKEDSHVPGQFPGKEFDDKNFLPKLQDSFDRAVIPPMTAVTTAAAAIPPALLVLGTENVIARQGLQRALDDLTTFVPTVQLDASQIKDLRSPPDANFMQDSFDRAVVPTTDAVKNTTSAIDGLKGKLGDDLVGVQSVTARAGDLTSSASTTAGRTAAAAALTGAFLVSSAVRGARPIITNNVDIDISGTSVVKQASVSTSYGPTTSSREGNLGTFGGNGPR